jgi:hypothetical protein
MSVNYTYTVEAFSPSLNQSVRQFNLMSTSLLQDNEQIARKDAEIWCEQLNRQQYMNRADWLPRVEHLAVGIGTIPGFLAGN